MSIATAQVSGAGSVAIDECTTIDESGAYYLNRTVNATASPCVRVEASDVVLDGRNYTVRGDNDSVGILVSGGSQLENVTVENLMMMGWGSAVEYSNVTTGEISDLEIRPRMNGDGSYGVRLIDSENVTVRNTVTEGLYSGIYLENSD
ncbi:MAG: hypothetical protein SXQ77_11620, partial [Halobacteria archaeon]|nr:hypothetical protein [Halobacteria archaeon]